MRFFGQCPCRSRLRLSGSVVGRHRFLPHIPELANSGDFSATFALCGRWLTRSGGAAIKAARLSVFRPKQQLSMFLGVGSTSPSASATSPPWQFADTAPGGYRQNCGFQGASVLFRTFSRGVATIRGLCEVRRRFLLSSRNAIWSSFRGSFPLHHCDRPYALVVRRRPACRVLPEL